MKHIEDSLYQKTHQTIQILTLFICNKKKSCYEYDDQPQNKCKHLHFQIPNRSRIRTHKNPPSLISLTILPNPFSLTAFNALLKIEAIAVPSQFQLQQWWRRPKFPDRIRERYNPKPKKGSNFTDLTTRILRSKGEFKHQTQLRWSQER